MSLTLTKRWLKEPLLHFVVIGGVLFAVYGWMNQNEPGTAEERAEIRIGPGEVQWLTETWSRQWQREPTPQELRGLVSDLLREQLLALEAKELGLDENDTIIRRRLAQKLEFLVQDTAQLVEPTDQELRQFYDANPERFTEPARVSFEHIYFSPDQRSDPAADARAALAVLSNNPPSSPGLFGDRLMLESMFENADESRISNQFGARFAESVFALETGDWQGPIESGYGLHLVRVSELRPGALVPFEEVRDRVQMAWNDERQQEANRRYLEALFEKYHIVVDESVRPLVGSLDAPHGLLE